MHHQLWITVISFHLMVVFLPVAMVLLYKRPDAWHFTLALFVGLLTGFINLHSD